MPLLMLQANSLSVLTVGQFFEGVYFWSTDHSAIAEGSGIPWGFFIANSPAYASEIVPLPLRGACTATLQMCWSIGGIIVAAVTYSYNQRMDQWAYRM